MLVADFAERAGIVMLPLLLIAGVVALVLAGLAVVTVAGSGLARTGHGSLAIALGVSVAWLVVYASGPDRIGVSRWEHAERFVGTFPVAAAIGIAAVTSLGLVASAAAPGLRVLRLVVAPAAVLSCLCLLYAWFALTAGH